MKQYVLLPRGGSFVDGGGAKAAAFFQRLRPVQAMSEKRAAAGGTDVRVVDRIGDDGPALIEVAEREFTGLPSELSGFQVVPIRYFRPAIVRRVRLAQRPQGTASAAQDITIQIRIRAADNGQPVAGAAVQAFTDFARRIGERATSRSTGNVFLRLPASTSKLERLYIDPTRGYWSLLLHDVRITDGDTFEVRPIEPGHVDVLRHFYARPVADPGAGVRVAVVDTGVGDHSDLTVGGGRNAVPGEDPGAWGDNGMGHGTHVAGIIAGKGASGSARGIAPAVDLRSYRVFAQNRQSAKSYPIAKAIEYAVADGCDLINLSLSDAHPDALTDTYITRARDTGAVVIAAAGNDGRRPVNFPARLQDVVAVAAMGRDGLFPADSADAIEVVKPFGADEKNFIAGFSNVGPQVRLVGPGVGVISTMPGGLFGAQSGTSMACPAVTGVAARLLSAKKTILNMKRDRKRSDAIVELLLGSARTLGFQPDFEGYGMPGADDGE